MFSEMCINSDCRIPEFSIDYVEFIKDTGECLNLDYDSSFYDKSSHHVMSFHENLSIWNPNTEKNRLLRKSDFNHVKKVCVGVGNISNSGEIKIKRLVIKFNKNTFVFESEKIEVIPN